ncbi:MAG: fold metallo-hydrolase, partial [Candidatus Eremiobacteraeota bacterium]|nr:fold metallo-hydrolase [Candidatus Eremiobacteraeota bacterium]
PLDRLGARLRAMDSTRWTAAYCKGGYRSSTACSLMRRGGLRVMNVRGGFDAWLARSLPFTTAPETRDR